MTAIDNTLSTDALTLLTATLQTLHKIGLDFTEQSDIALQELYSLPADDPQAAVLAERSNCLRQCASGMFAVVTATAEMLSQSTQAAVQQYEPPPMQPLRLVPREAGA